MDVIEVTRLENQVKKAKAIEKQLIGMVIEMAQESMCPESYKKFCDAMNYMAGNRHLDLSDIL
jgi:phage-related protein